MDIKLKKNFPAHKMTVFYSSAEVSRRVASLAKEIADYLRSENIENDDFVIISLLKGAFIFTADLLRALFQEDVHPQVDFMALSSYGDGRESLGQVIVKSDTKENLSGKHVLVVDDILESGRTLSFVKNLMKERGAKSVKTIVFLEKPGKRAIEIEADFVGFMVPDKFVVGYGLDSASNFRELPFVALLEG